VSHSPFNFDSVHFFRQIFHGAPAESEEKERKKEKQTSVVRQTERESEREREREREREKVDYPPNKGKKDLAKEGKAKTGS